MPLLLWTADRRFCAGPARDPVSLSSAVGPWST
jgi:hypothetical protein